MQLQGFTSWMSDEEAKQSKVNAHEEPVLESSTISARLVQLKHAFERLNKKKKPAPPPVIKPEANATGEHCCGNVRCLRHQMLVTNVSTALQDMHCLLCQGFSCLPATCIGKGCAPTWPALSTSISPMCSSCYASWEELQGG